MAKPLLLFLHGLGGDAQATWGKFKDLLEQDPTLGDRVDVAFHSFITKPVRLRFLSWKSVSIQDISRDLQTRLEHQFTTYNNILLICHSMGGLVAKHCLCDMVRTGAPLRVKGVIFFATPHSGAALAGLADRISIGHRHVKQLKPDSDFLDLVTEQWANLDCESKVQATYVVGGQDAVVPRNSAGPSGVSVRLIADKGHINIVKPQDDSDLSYLIVKRTAERLFLDVGSNDLEEVRKAIAARDSYALVALVANRGRSWIETTNADAAIAVLKTIVEQFDPRSAEVIWSRYLIAVSRLFRERDASSTAFDDELVQYAEAVGLGALIFGEIMEFARKRGDRDAALNAARELLPKIKDVKLGTDAGNAYALGTAHFLVGNLYRYGGQYRRANAVIAHARTFFRPAIIAHQIELAHCHYAQAVCRAMEGSLRIEEVSSIPLSREFRRFSDALITLTLSHSAWSAGNLGEATDHAERASKAFDQISFAGYAARARSLVALLAAWQRLDLGASIDKAVAYASDYATIIRGMVGDPQAVGALKLWISKTRASHVLGMLQFASAYNKSWGSIIGDFQLPPILEIHDATMTWSTGSASSLQEADRILRQKMGISLEVNVPVLAD